MDAEIKAMGEMAAALEPLDENVRARVLRWASERYGVKIPVPPPASARAASSSSPMEQSAQTQPQFATFDELFDAANPETSTDKALVAAYWFQVAQGQDDFESQQLNTELKNLGHPSSNITRDLDGLINRTPRYVMQTRKEGTTKQARKRYKITREGIRAVERMANTANAPE